jgi:hypothetical protein
VWLLAVLAFLPVMHVLLGIFDCTKVAVAVDDSGSGSDSGSVTGSVNGTGSGETKTV